MAFSSSNIPTYSIATMVAAGGTTFWSAGGFVANTVNVSLWGNACTTTPTARDAILANNGYGAASGQWVSLTNESTASTSGYTAGGSALTGKAITAGVGTVSATTTTQTLAWTIVGTLSATYGCMVYDNTITNKYCYCWNYFGGSNTVSGGTFTLTWFGTTPYQLYTITIT
jgi:hypothetical protein